MSRAKPAGVAPPEFKPLPKMSASLGKVYVAALRCRNIILDGLNAN